LVLFGWIFSLTMSHCSIAPIFLHCCTVHGRRRVCHAQNLLITRNLPYSLAKGFHSATRVSFEQP
jgi:hypothetical protein